MEPNESAPTRPAFINISNLSLYFLFLFHGTLSSNKQNNE